MGVFLSFAGRETLRCLLLETDAVWVNRQFPLKMRMTLPILGSYAFFQLIFLQCVWRSFMTSGKKLPAHGNALAANGVRLGAQTIPPSREERASKGCSAEVANSSFSNLLHVKEATDSHE